MDIQRIFQILGIAETRQESEIKAAYRQQLVSVNPEINPEGFKRLRAAYEQALVYSKQEPVQKKEGPVDLYGKRLDALYRNLPRRLDRKQWEELLQDEILEDLEFGEAARREMFSYLADHFRLPRVIWKMLSDYFCIPENQQEFKEYLPVQFIDFILQKVEEDDGEREFDFKKLSGPEEADYDGFIEDLNELLQLMNNEPEGENEDWLKAVGERIAGMAPYGVTHPWFELEKAKYDLILGKSEEAEKRVRDLWATGEREDRSLLGGALILNGCGKEEEAEKILLKFTERKEENGDVYRALFEMGKILLKRDLPEEARDYAVRARKIYNTEQVKELMDECNLRLIEVYQNRKPEELTMEEAIRLCWCYIQTEREQEGLEFFTIHPLLTEDTIKCHKVKAVLFMQNGKEQEAVEEARLWRKKLLQEEEPEQEELAYSFELEGRGLAKRYSILKREEGEEDSKKARKVEILRTVVLKTFDKAIKYCPDMLQFLMDKMLFLRELKNYEAMEEICQQMIEIDHQFFWAYFYLQEAYEGQGKAQEIIDTFYQAKELYAGLPEIYERAVRVFRHYEMYKEVKDILRQAKEAQVDSPYLMVKRLERMEEEAKTEEEYREADAFAQQVITQLEKQWSEWEEQAEAEKEQPEIEEESKEHLQENLSEAYMERVYIHEKKEAVSFQDVDGMEGWMQRALKLQDSLWNRYYLGRFYVLFKKDSQAAYQQLIQCEERGMSFEWLYYYIAICYEEEERWDDATVYFKKAHEKAPDNDDFLWRIGWRYRWKFSQTGQIEYYHESLKYLQQQIERFGATATDHWQLADLYAAAGDIEAAIKEHDLSLEGSCSARNLSAKADTLEGMGRFEEAMELCQRAVAKKQEEGEEYTYVYERIYGIFCKMDSYQEGVEWFEAGLDKLLTQKQRGENLEHLCDLYCNLKNWEKALESIKRRFGGTTLKRYLCDSWKKEGERISGLLKIYRHSLSSEELIQRVKEAVNLLEAPEGERMDDDIEAKYDVWDQIAITYTNYLLDDEQGLSCLKKALAYAADRGKATTDYREALEDIMFCLWRLGRRSEAKQYSEQYKEALALQYQGCEELGKSLDKLQAGNRTNAKRSLYQMFLLYFFAGEEEKAEDYAKQLEKASWCSNCSNKVCTEEWLCKGYLALHRGKEEEAMECFIQANAAAVVYSGEAMREIRRLERKKQGE